MPWLNHCDRRITHHSDTDISFVLFNISSKFRLYLECYLLSPKMHKKVSKYIKHSKKYISITKKSDMSITVIYHAMSLTVLYLLVLHYWCGYYASVKWEQQTYMYNGQMIENA